VRGIIDVLDGWKRIGELQTRCYGAVAAERKLLNPEKETVMMQDQHGHQLIRVKFDDRDNLYSYAWAGEGELAVGDQVETPVPYWVPPEDAISAKPGIATVVELGSDWAGTTTALTRKAKGES
jgi:hypothetical protein